LSPNDRRMRGCAFCGREQLATTSRKAARFILLAVATTAIAVVPGVESLARSRKKAPEIPVYVPPPPAGPVGLPDRLLGDAAAYEAYLLRVTATTPAGFTDGASVARALKAAAAYEPRVLVRGEIAYGAVAALQNPTFVAQVRAAGNSPENRKIMVDYILHDPGYAFRFQGADAAAGLIKEALGGAGLRLYATGKVIKQSAYDVQHQMWSREEIADRAGRLASVEAAAAQGVEPASERVAILQRAATGAEPLPLVAPSAPPPYTPLIARAMQLAAIAALGEATDAAYDQLTSLTADADTDACLHMAKLNLYQCLAVAKPHYEDIFCMGQHVMVDTGACLARGVGVEVPADPLPPPKPVPASTTKRTKHRAHAS
jgi:hypothetical protein